MGIGQSTRIWPSSVGVSVMGLVRIELALTPASTVATSDGARPSWLNLGARSVPVQVVNIPVYRDGALIFGNEPR